MAKPTSRLGVEQFAGRGGPQDLPPSMLQYGVGLQLFDPSVYANGGGHTFADGIVASPGGGQLNATKLKAAINHITVCATAGDSLALPPAVGGQMLVVINDGIADAQVFAAPGTSDTINGVAGATGMALAPSTSVLLSAPGHHVWYSTPSGDAVGSSPGVTSWNTRVGAVTLTVGDVTAVLPASATNPAMDGTAAPGVSPTWSAGDHVHPTDSTRYAASNPAGYVTAGGAATAAPVQSVATRTGAVTLTHADITDWTATLAPYATLASPALSGNPTAPTPAPGDADTSVATTAFVQVAQRYQNYADNSGFSVNQRAYVSGTALAAGIYGHDRWKAGAGGCTYTFAAPAGPANSITITAGTLQHVVEGASVAGGNYVLSWAGTAQGRVGGAAYAASPVAVTGIAAGANTTIEFNAGTLSNVKLEAGTVATAWVAKAARDELSNCQRFYQIGQLFAQINNQLATGAFNVSTPLIMSMRASPTVFGGVNSSSNITGFNVAAINNIAVYNAGTATAAGTCFISATFSASADL